MTETKFNNEIRLPIVLFYRFYYYFFFFPSYCHYFPLPHTEISDIFVVEARNTPTRRRVFLTFANIRDFQSAISPEYVLYTAFIITFHYITPLTISQNPSLVHGIITTRETERY